MGVCPVLRIVTVISTGSVAPYEIFSAVRESCAPDAAGGATWWSSLGSEWPSWMELAVQPARNRNPKQQQSLAIVGMAESSGERLLARILGYAVETPG